LANALPQADAPPVNAKQKCTIFFKSGTPLMLESMGFVVRDCGLFLFLPTTGLNVLRWFFPAASMLRYQIGDLIGEMLVKEASVPISVVNSGLEIQEELRSKKIGDYLRRQHIVTKEQVEQALKNQSQLPPVRLGDALLQENLITEAQLNEALEKQAVDRKKQLGDILISMNAVSAATINRILAQKLGIPFVNLHDFEIDESILKVISVELIHKHCVFPLFQNNVRLVVALENPLASTVLQEISFYTKLKIDPVIASHSDLLLAIERHYGAIANNKIENISMLVSEMGEGLQEVFATAPEMVQDSDNLMVRLVNKIILDAHEQGVSDIHIESMKNAAPTRVRFRKDGLMFDYSEVPANYRNALVSRIKIMSRLDISEKRHSQDGKINFKDFSSVHIELRVVTMPTTEGYEDIVMRILAAPRAVSLDGVGLMPNVLAELKRLSERPHGLLFVCGPTGSGKTTTLHAMVAHINTPEKKIWTAEDPIEITQKGLRQVQAQSKIGWTFAAILRSFMRADPDVIMVGETRDPETAKIVIEASLTGHLVFSTMHTNSAAESVIRLLDLGLDPFNFADALLGVVGQRLVRKLCKNCRQPHNAKQEELDILAYEYCLETLLQPSDVINQWKSRFGIDGDNIILFSHDGCKQCNNTGYKGRLGVHELLVTSPAVKKKIHAKANVADLLAVAVSEGMKTLKQDGIEKIFLGLTDWEQIKML